MILNKILLAFLLVGFLGFVSFRLFHVSFLCEICTGISFPGEPGVEISGKIRSKTIVCVYFSAMPLAVPSGGGGLRAGCVSVVWRW